MDKTVNKGAEVPIEKKQKNKKAIIIITVILVLVLLIAGVFIYMMVSDVSLQEIIEPLFPEKPHQTFELNEFLVNALSKQGVTDQVLRINIAIKHVHDEEGIIRASEPIIRDIILSNLKNLKIETLLDEDTVDILKEDIKNQINSYFKNDFEESPIVGIFVTDLIIR